MRLQELMSAAATSPRTVVEKPTAERTAPETGLNTFVAEFVLCHRIIKAECHNPERRLSDLLNGSTPGLEVTHILAEEDQHGQHGVTLQRTGQIGKAHLLFVVPVQEPPRPAQENNAAWRATATRRCRLGIGPYAIEGRIHSEPGRDPRHVIRSHDKPFVPVSSATVVDLHGQLREFPVVIVNRAQVEYVALLD